MRFVSGALAVLFAVVMLAVGAAAFSETVHAHRALGAGALAAGAGSLFAGFVMLVDRKPDD